MTPRLFAAAALLVACALVQARDAVLAKSFIVAAAHPLATEAGYDALRRGGSVVDAAIAVQMVLGLVEPESSGIGGGAFLLHWSEGEKKLRSYDGRETAPAAARPDRFLADGRPLAFRDAATGGRSVGVPGVVRMLELAHQRHGRLPWAELFRPAIRLAEEGFPLSAKLHALMQAESAVLYPGKAAGERVTNPAYGATLRAIAAGGASAMHQGAIAHDIVSAVGGDLTAADMATYRPVEREPVCGPYRAWRICSMGPPSSGGVAVLQILGMLERTPFASAAPQSAQAVHYFAEAGRLAYADRARFLGDPDVVAVPIARLLSGSYLSSRAKLIGERSLGQALPGDKEGGTSHFSIVAANGDAVSMTTTIEGLFGSRIVVRGFLLNNQLTDFDFVPGSANEVGPGKRPRSSMAPTMVFDGAGRLQLVVGSPGGSAIINYVAKALVGVLDWRLDIQQAIDLPNFGSRNGPTQIEAGTALEQLAPALAERGHQVNRIRLQSGLHGVERVPGGWRGGADSRREGTVRGD
ncbi:MAG TPA: gamma-glutamyltransferase [Burkholderiales bacterium]|nr:gamma-glutamyltransferase [Burkholderiales bacterium]